MNKTTIRTSGAILTTLVTLSACDSGSSEAAATPTHTTLTACVADQMDVLGVDTLSHADSATVCQTLQDSIGHVPSVRIAKGLSLAISGMQMKGDKTPVADQAYQYTNIAEARGKSDSDEALYNTFNVVFKIYGGSSGHVTPRDINMALRAMEPEQARTISDDGMYSLGAIIQEAKKANGE